jgi:hypothetical protein
VDEIIKNYHQKRTKENIYQINWLWKKKYIYIKISDEIKHGKEIILNVYFQLNAIMWQDEAKAEKIEINVTKKINFLFWLH